MANRVATRRGCGPQRAPHRPLRVRRIVLGRPRSCRAVGREGMEGPWTLRARGRDMRPCALSRPEGGHRAADGARGRDGHSHAMRFGHGVALASPIRDESAQGCDPPLSQPVAATGLGGRRRAGRGRIVMGVWQGYRPPACDPRQRPGDRAGCGAGRPGDALPHVSPVRAGTGRHQREGAGPGPDRGRAPSRTRQTSPDRPRPTCDGLPRAMPTAIAGCHPRPNAPAPPPRDRPPAQPREPDPARPLAQSCSTVTRSV